MVAHMGGAIASVAPDATAFSNRDAEFFYHSVLLWDDPAHDARNVAFARSLWNEMRPHASGAYVNFFEDDEDRLHEAYAEQTLERLVALKRDYDPQNLFRLNANIVP
jgi:FAD/FMN-containing dehydrogenase